jgi:hypothetical protein
MKLIGQENTVGTTGEIVVYQPDEITRLEVRVNEDTVWLTQVQIAHLFGVGQPAISKHLKNIFASEELSVEAVHSILEYTAADGKSYKTGFYNLDAILSVGYRVNSRNATRFRQWANKEVVRIHPDGKYGCRRTARKNMSKDSSPEQNILSEIERIRKLFYSECKDYRLFINFSRAKNR